MYPIRFEEPIITSVIDVKKIAAWGESGFPARFLGPGQPDLQVEAIASPEIQTLLDRMSPLLRAPLADNLYVQQDLRVYDEDAAWVIKACGYSTMD